MVMIRNRRLIIGKHTKDCNDEIIPSRNYFDKLLPNKHNHRSPCYVWMVIHGPEYLVGRIMPKNILKIGGWTTGTIIAKNIQNGKILEIIDTIEAVI